METYDKSSLCYHCRVYKTGRICFKDESDPSPREEDESKPSNFLKGLSEPIYSAYIKAMLLKKMAGTAIMEFLDYFRYRKLDHKFDIIDKDKSEFEYSVLPEHIRRCDRCLCYYSTLVKCHCVGCLGSSQSHYMIMMHGILSSQIMMTDACRVIMEKHPSLFVYFPVCACGKTLHGTSLVIKFLTDELNMLFSKLPSSFSLSFLGHSYGGIILRCFFVNYFRTLAKENLKGKRRKSLEKNITWKNLICVATPHSGIYEDNREMRKIFSLIDSETVNELENETIHLLFLLKDYGFVDQFEKFLIYGNVSGDMMVAPRTSIILPYHMYSDSDLNKIQKIMQKSPGKPKDITKIYFRSSISQSTEVCEGTESDSDGVYMEYNCDMVYKKTDFSKVPEDFRNKQERDSGDDRSLSGTESDPELECFKGVGKNKVSDHSIDSDSDVEHPIDREALTGELINKFAELVDKKMSNSKDLKSLHNLLLPTTDYNDNASSDSTKSSRGKKANSPRFNLFTKQDFDKFNEAIVEIVRSCDSSFLNRLRSDDSLFYFEVLLSLMYKMPASKFAVYIPRILMPHRTIISLQAPVAHETYTDDILSHITNHSSF